MAVGRFQVMATLQAARAYVLGLPLEVAKSWGLNRAIFYAAAKRGLLKVRSEVKKEMRLKGIPLEPEKVEKVRKSFNIFRLGDEMAYSVVVDGKRRFMIGDKIQSEEDFARQIESRFGEKFNEAWEEAVSICKKYDKGLLRSQRYFYETVYKPRRDELAKKWTELSKS